MNESIEQGMTNDPRALDRLVDDELDEGQRQQVLSELQADPDGWRRCAMAFLEAQAWRRAMVGMAQDVESPMGERPHHTQPTCAVTQGRVADEALTREQPHRLGWFAAAAGILISFALGAASQHFLPSHDVDFPRSVAGREGFNSRPRRDQSAISASDVPPQQFRSDGSLVPERLDGLAGRSDWEFEPSAPFGMLEALEQAGHKIHRQRGFVPFRLEDGRQGFVPVEDLFVVPVNRITY